LEAPNKWKISYPQPLIGQASIRNFSSTGPLAPVASSVSKTSHRKCCHHHTTIMSQSWRADTKLYPICSCITIPAMGVDQNFEHGSVLEILWAARNGCHFCCLLTDALRLEPSMDDDYHVGLEKRHTQLFAAVFCRGLLQSSCCVPPCSQTIPSTVSCL